jgi:hypothetical protein
LKSSFTPSYQSAKIARIAAMISRMRAAGFDHGMLNRLVTCGWICEPSPSVKRPREYALRSCACIASSIGLRANATAMPVINRRWLNARRRAATAGTDRAPPRPSMTPSKPSASNRAASSPTPRRSDVRYE